MTETLSDVGVESRYRSLFDAIDEAFCIVRVVFDSHGRAIDYQFLEVNPAFVRHTGLDDVTGHCMRELVPEHEEHWFEIYGEVAKTGDAVRFESHARALGDRWYDVFAFRVDAPELCHVAILFSDISRHRRETRERQDALASAREANALLDAFSQSAPVGLAFLDLELRYRRINPRLAAMNGLPAEAHIGRRPDEILHEVDSMPEIMARLQGVIDSGVPWLGGEVSGETPAAPGDPRTWLESFYPVRVQGAIVGLGVMVEDVTAYKRATAALAASATALREADQRKDDFLATLAHELRNPLAPIRTGVHLLGRMDADASKQARVLEMMDRQVTHLVRLVDDLLDISRITRNKVELRRQPIELNQLLRRTLESSQGALDARQHTLQVSLWPRSLDVEGDPDRLMQVFANLISNAAKFTPPGGVVRVESHAEGPCAVVSVRDTGIGIAKDKIHTVFEMFSQVHSPTPQSTEGLGIGLALVRNLIQRHGGSAVAESDGEGQGSCFTVRLPLAPVVHETAVAHERSI